MALCDVSEPKGSKTRKKRSGTRRGRGGSTKERLILAAIVLSAQRGFSNVPLRDVVEHAECLNISAVHYHFKSREGLLTAVLDKIGRHWAVEVPDHARRGGIFGILNAFMLGLDELKKSASWGNSVVKFLTRLAMEDDPATAEAATAFLARHLNAVYDAVAPYCPDVNPAVLRLRVGNACLLLLTISSHLDRSCMAALGCDNLVEVKERLVQETVAMAASIIQGVRPVGVDVADEEAWADDDVESRIAGLAVAHRSALPQQALA